MSVRKRVNVVYVAPIPDLGVSAHVKLEWIGDEQGRTHTTLLPLPDDVVAKIAAMPDARKVATVYLCGTAALDIDPENGGLVEFAMSPEALSDWRDCSDSCGIVEAELSIGDQVVAPVHNRTYSVDEVREMSKASDVAARELRKAALRLDMSEKDFRKAVEKWFYEHRHEEMKARQKAREAREKS